MKKNWVLVVAVAVAIGFVSCKAKESSYKAAYEKAQEKPVAEQTLAPEPVVTKPASSSDTSSSPVRVSTEKITTVNAGDASKLMQSRRRLHLQTRKRVVCQRLQRNTMIH